MQVAFESWSQSHKRTFLFQNRLHMQNYNQGLKLITCGVNGQQILICSYFCNGVNACSTIDIWNKFEIVSRFKKNYS